jgi:hypothetical protein
MRELAFERFTWSVPKVALDSTAFLESGLVALAALERVLSTKLPSPGFPIRMLMF